MSRNRSPITDGTAALERPWKVRVIESDAQLTEELLDKFMQCEEGVFTHPDSFKSGWRDIVKTGGKIYYVMDSAGTKVIGCAGTVVQQKNEQSDPLEPDIKFFSAVVNKNSRARGVYNELNHSRVEEVISLRAKDFRVRTQNPRVENSIHKTLAEFKREGKIKDFSLLRERTDTSDGKPITTERQHTGNREIDDSYALLNFGKGECYFLTFTITYP